MDVLNRAVETIKKGWAGLSAGRRAALATIAAALLLLLFWGYRAASDDMVRLLGPEVTAEERAQALQELKAKKQHVEVRGDEIYVRRREKDRLFLELQGGLSDSSLRKLIETNSWWEPGSERQKKYHLALQMRLEQVIRSLEAVKNASVLITPAAESTHFGAPAPKATASVTIDLHPGRELTRGNVTAIARIVSGAVSGLDPERIHIADTRGRPYRVASAEAGAAGDLREIEKELEDDIRRQIQDAYPSARVFVRVAARSTDTVREEHRLEGPPKILEERERRKTQAAPPAPPPIKGQQEGPEGPAAPRGDIRESELELKQAYNQMKIQERMRAGAVEKVSIGVLLPVEYGNDEELKLAREQESRIKRLLTIVGRPYVDENSVEVALVPTRRPVPPPPPTLGERLAAAAEEHWPSAALILLGLVGLYLLYRLARAALPKGVVEDLETLRAHVTREGAVAGAGPAALADDEVTRMKAGIKEMIGRNPRGVAVILKRWLAGK